MPVTRNKPGIVTAALICFIFFMVVSFIFVLLFQIVMPMQMSGFTAIFFIVTIPYAIGVIILLKKNPQKWHHTYCSIVGNVSGFIGIVDVMLAILTGEFNMNSIFKTGLSVIVIFIFLKFDFSEQARRYFGK